MDPLVTIAIPTYNRAASYLPEALGSALAQDYPNLEIIVADNGSTDATEAQLRRLRDPRLRYLRHATALAPNDNFNFCLAQARGDYLVLLHDDDLLDADFISSCMAMLGAGSDVGVIRSGSRLIDQDRRILALQPNLTPDGGVSELLLSWFRGHTTIYFCNTLFHTERLRALGGWRTPGSVFEDAAAIVRLAARYGQRNLPAVKASFRLHGANRGDQGLFSAWLTDAGYLDELISQTVPQQRALLELGRRYLARKCYRYAAQLPWPQQPEAYWQVYRRFGCPPWRWLAAQQLARGKRLAVRLCGARDRGRLEVVPAW